MHRIVPDAATCPAPEEMNIPGAAAIATFDNCTHCGPRLIFAPAQHHIPALHRMAPFPLVPL